MEGSLLVFKLEPEFVHHMNNRLNEIVLLLSVNKIEDAISRINELSATLKRCMKRTKRTI